MFGFCLSRTQTHDPNARRAGYTNNPTSSSLIVRVVPSLRNQTGFLVISLASPTSQSSITQRLLSTRARGMNYEQRLTAATMIIESGSHGESGCATAPLNATEIGVTATLKPHQLEGISWLIQRYRLGVNVILGRTLISHFNFLICKI